MRYPREKLLCSAPYVNIFISTYYIILAIYVESFSRQYMGALRGSYVVDIVSRARLLRRHWSVLVNHWQWRVKTRLRDSTSLLLPLSSRQSDRNYPSSLRLLRSPLLVPTSLLLRWPVAGLLRRVVPWGLVKHLHELAGSNGEGP